MAARKTKSSAQPQGSRTKTSTKGRQKQSNADRLSGGPNRAANSRPQQKGAFRGSRFDAERQGGDSGRRSTPKSGSAKKGTRG
jgi:hypothetical protein